MSRTSDLRRFYDVLARLSDAAGYRRLSDWPGPTSQTGRGVYFFFEDGETRSDSGSGARVVRVGTHALKAGSKSSLAGRLKMHRGTTGSGGGHHRGSVFRLHVGLALAAREPELAVATWAVGSTARADVRVGERALEGRVSNVIGEMTVVCLPVEDVPGPASERGYVERNAIGLLSNMARGALDPPSSEWLGRSSRSDEIRESGLWNGRGSPEP